jgi:hypothetical protein
MQLAQQFQARCQECLLLVLLLVVVVMEVLLGRRGTITSKIKRRLMQRTYEVAVRTTVHDTIHCPSARGYRVGGGVIVLTQHSYVGGWKQRLEKRAGP